MGVRQCPGQRLAFISLLPLLAPRLPPLSPLHLFLHIPIRARTAVLHGHSPSRKVGVALTASRSAFLVGWGCAQVRLILLPVELLSAISVSLEGPAADPFCAMKAPLEVVVVLKGLAEDEVVNLENSQPREASASSSSRASAKRVGAESTSHQQRHPKKRKRQDGLDRVLEMSDSSGDQARPRSAPSRRGPALGRPPEARAAPPSPIRVLEEDLAAESPARRPDVEMEEWENDTAQSHS